MKELSLRYSDERDKIYGIAGMAITLVACDEEDILSGINIDAEPGECLELSNECALKGNPLLSAKIVWTQSVKDLKTITTLALGNIACRRYVLSHRSLSSNDTHDLRHAVRTEALEYCALDADEADNLFNNCMSYVDRIFRHSGVHDIAHSFAETLKTKRTMTAVEVIDLLAQLGLR